MTIATLVMPGLVQVSLLLTRRWFYHAVSVFLQSVLLLVVAYTTFYYRVDNFQVSLYLRVLQRRSPIVNRLLKM